MRDELMKIMMTPNAAKGIILLEELDLMHYILPELRDGDRASGRICTISIPFLSTMCGRWITPPSENYSLVVRMAALLHDVGKPQVKERRRARIQLL